jgi:ABC-type hemin transport system substrate-binding protein
VRQYRMQPPADELTAQSGHSQQGALWRANSRRCVYTPGVRIASLHPAATEVVHLLGLDDALVGVSADSDWPPDVVQRVPVLNAIATTRAR